MAIYAILAAKITERCASFPSPMSMLCWAQSPFFLRIPHPDQRPNQIRSQGYGIKVNTSLTPDLIEILQRSIGQSRQAPAAKPEAKPASKPKPLSSPNPVQPEVVVDEDEFVQTEEARIEAIFEHDPV